MKQCTRILALLLCVACTLSLMACSDELTASQSNFELSHYSGADTSNGYDTELLYTNEYHVWGGDTAVLYVSEEQSPEYGGYYYQYMSANGSLNPKESTFIGEDGKTYRQKVMVLRSKDLVDWEVCGSVDSGMGLLLAEDEWVWDYTWAPETIYDEKTGKYYMYFSAQVRELTNDLVAKGARYKNYYNSDGTHEWKSELNLGIAVSDTPVGPFRLVSSQNVYGSSETKTPAGDILTGINPPIMFYEHYDMEAEFSAIDLHPFFDENGDLYLYFVKHMSVSTEHSDDQTVLGNQIWGIKMLDMVTPDYSTITKLVGNGNIVNITYKGDDQMSWDEDYPRNLDSSYDHSTTFPDGKEYAETPSDGSVVEAPQVITTKDKDGNTVYLLSYSVRGVGAYNYDVHYAYSYSPLGPYTKAPASSGKTMIEFDYNNDFVSNLGHHDFIQVGDELWFVYCTWPVGASEVSGRGYAIDQMGWLWKEFPQANGEVLEILVPVANGPTQTVQPLMAEVTGYHNVVDEATIKVSSGEGTEYLSDGVVSTTAFLSQYEFCTSEDELTITLTFDEPKDIRGILIYNSYDYLKAFSCIDSIVFGLAETPECYTGGEATSCFIRDLQIDPWTVNEDNKVMRAGGGAVATFAQIKVTSITIKISQTVAGDYSEGIAISDIYVMGK